MAGMRAMVIRNFGGPETFEETELPIPEPGPGQVRVKVAATSWNPIESKIRAGLARLGPEFPAVLNSDVAGVVDGVGSGVKGFSEGDNVFACSGGIKGGQGALAEYTLVDARLLAEAPSSLSLAESATLPIGFITSWYAMRRLARVEAGQKVLVIGGTGGVGNVASNRTHSNQQSRVETLTDSNAGNSKRARDGLSKDKPDSFRKVLSSI